MRRKSKLTTFILSFIPGLAHAYIGYADRGMIYLIITGVVCGGSIIMGLVSHSSFFLLTLFGGYALIWLIALIDAFSLINDARYEERYENEEGVFFRDNQEMNKKMISLALALIPGAGHMYLGYQEKGLIYMGVFFFTIFFMGWLNLSFLLFLVPLIWFYAFFDAFHLVNEGVEEGGRNKEEGILSKIHHQYIGKGLILLGILILLQKLLFPLIGQFLDYRYRNYIQASLLSLALILIGIRMLRGKKEIEEREEKNEN